MRFTAVSCEVPDTAVLFIVSDGTCEKIVYFECPANALKINYFFALVTGNDMCKFSVIVERGERIWSFSMN